MTKRGLLLQGGGALGAWQAAALEVLLDSGRDFDAVMGYSIGAVNGTALALGRLHRALDFWTTFKPSQALHFQPRLSPFSIFAPVALEKFLPETQNEESAKAALRAELNIISACRAENAPINARFTPGGRRGWDAPILAHLKASCAIPCVYPPVELSFHGRALKLIDGGVPMAAPFDVSPLADCSEILALEMVRPEEAGRRYWSPWRVHDQFAREAGFHLTSDAVGQLNGLSSRPRIQRLLPSRVLKPMMLDFRAAGIQELLELGKKDARAFLSS